MKQQMRQQIIVSGRGGQGVIFLTRLLAEAAIEMNLDLLTSETHGMAMRGGTVISHIKIGGFKSPLIMSQKADVGLFLNLNNLSFHKSFMKGKENIVVNTGVSGDYLSVDADGCAKELGSLLLSNLILVGYAIKKKVLFCNDAVMKKVIEKRSKNRKIFDMNIEAFNKGYLFDMNIEAF